MVHSRLYAWAAVRGPVPGTRVIRPVLILLTLVSLVSTGTLMAAEPSQANAPGIKIQAFAPHWDGRARCIDIGGWSTANGARVVKWVCGAHQHNQMFEWRLVGGTSNQYEIRPLHARDKCLDNAGWSTSAGARIITWACHGGRNQHWDLIGHSDGKVSIRNVHSGMCIDIPGGNSDEFYQDNRDLAQWYCTNTRAQWWKLERA